MNPQNSHGLSAPAIVAIAAAAASAAGGVAVGLMRRRQPEPPPPVWQRSPGDLLTDPRVRAFTEAARSAMQEAVGRLEARDGEVIREEMSKRLGQVLETARDDLPPLSRDVAERAREAADRLLSQGGTVSADLGERLRTEVAPAARNLAQEAIAEAEEILASAGERASEVAGDLARTARTEYVPRIGPATAAAAGAAGAALAGAVQAIGQRVSRPAAVKPPAGARGAVNQFTSRAGAALQEAGSQTAHATQQLGLICFWSCALGTVVYYGLLNPEQRRKVRGGLTRAYGQVRSMLGGMQGS